jgi:hypothetical protein
MVHQLHSPLRNKQTLSLVEMGDWYYPRRSKPLESVIRLGAKTIFGSKDNVRCCKMLVPKKC